ncbi:hypothetical protein AKJ16_DCAP08728 [Drosera capensis]
MDVIDPREIQSVLVRFGGSIGDSSSPYEG